MPDKHLHIVSFDIPYPPNYGGVIDVFYKLKALHRKGIKIILHSFEYPGRERSEKLLEYCTAIHYYPRLVGFGSALSTKPYIVASRKSNNLLENLCKDKHPILFEGLHSCYYLDHPALDGRFKIYRESNIEHQYYFNLFKVDKNIFNKLYYFVASIKLMAYQKVLKHADLMLAVSRDDTEYLSNHFPENAVGYLPSFHANEAVVCHPGRGDYALYNGNIEVPENAHAVKYLIKEVFNDISIPLVVAGMNPPEYILKLAEQHDNVKIVANPDDAEMFELIRNAHTNILVTFQATGLKLKLLNTLYMGKFCLVNDKMLNGTGLDELCVIANSSREFKQKLKSLFKKDFTAPEIELRKKILSLQYSNDRNADTLIKLVYDMTSMVI
jgi:hypothetical protein